MRRSPAPARVIATATAGALALSACAAPLATTSPSPDPSAPPSPGPTASPSPSAVPTATSSASPAPSASHVPSPSPTASDGRTAVDVIITIADQRGSVVEVASFVPSEIELDGRCTLTLSRAVTSVSSSRDALPDATSTSCGRIAVSVDELSTGTWIAVVEYESETSVGTSDPTTIEVMR